MLKEDLLDIMREIHEGTMRFDKLNYANIALIPKKDGPELMADYHLIALLNSSVKIISKVWANRLGPTL